MNPAQQVAAAASAVCDCLDRIESKNVISLKRLSPNHIAARKPRERPMLERHRAALMKSQSRVAQERGKLSRALARMQFTETEAVP